MKQTLYVDLMIDNEWLPVILLFGPQSGMHFYRQQMGSDLGSETRIVDIRAENASFLDASHVKHISHNEVVFAQHAPGLDFYDGVIDVELVDNTLEQVRVGHLNATMHNLLTAINIYREGTAGAALATTSDANKEAPQAKLAERTNETSSAQQTEAQIQPPAERVVTEN